MRTSKIAPQQVAVGDRVKCLKRDADGKEFEGRVVARRGDYVDVKGFFGLLYSRNWPIKYIEVL